MTWEPSHAARHGDRFNITILKRCIHNPVAPESAINVFVVNEVKGEDGDFVREELVFLGHVGKEIAERIGPLMTQAVVRVGITQVHWDTFNTDFKGEWYIDIVLFVPLAGLEEAARVQVDDAIHGLPVAAYPAVRFM